MLRFWNRLRGHPVEQPQRTGLFPSVLRFERAAYVEAVAVVAAKLAKVDGPVTRAEIDCFKRLFPLDPNEQAVVAPLFDLARETPDGFRPFAIQLTRMLASEPKALGELFEHLYRIALADGSLTSQETDFLEVLARLLGVEDLWESLQSRDTIEGDPYAVLGVTRDVSDEDLRQTWHHLIRLYHPDAAAARGEDDADHARVAAINDAYRRIVRSRKRRKQA